MCCQLFCRCFIGVVRLVVRRRWSRRQSLFPSLVLRLCYNFLCFDFLAFDLLFLRLCYNFLCFDFLAFDLSSFLGGLCFDFLRCSLVSFLLSSSRDFLCFFLFLLLSLISALLLLGRVSFGSFGLFRCHHKPRKQKHMTYLGVPPQTAVQVSKSRKCHDSKL
jgi:hypothetical protein